LVLASTSAWARRIAFSVAKELGIPISYVVLGLKETNMAEFRPDTYVDSLFFGEGDGF